MKCVICGRRPSRQGAYCQICADKLDSQKRRNGNGEPKHYLTYKGHVVGLYPAGEKQLKPRLLGRSAEHLPKGKTIDLNHYCQGFSREVIKRFKACVLQLAHA